MPRPLSRQAAGQPRSFLNPKDVQTELNRLYWQAKRKEIPAAIYPHLIRNLVAIKDMMYKEQDAERLDMVNAKLETLRQMLLAAGVPEDRLPAWTAGITLPAVTVEGKAERVEDDPLGLE